MAATAMRTAGLAGREELEHPPGILFGQRAVPHPSVAQLGQMIR